FDQVRDIAEGPGLGAVAVDRERVPVQGLHDEVRHHASVVFLHSRPVGVEDTGDFDVQMELLVIVEKQRFGATLASVLTGPWSDRVEISPIGLRLRVDVWLAMPTPG